MKQLTLLLVMLLAVPAAKAEWYGLVESLGDKEIRGPFVSEKKCLEWKAQWDAVNKKMGWDDVTTCIPDQKSNKEEK
jgi:hypothetical protein